MKPFKDFDSQIQLLADRNLNIDLKNNLREYLENYSYQRVINGYNDPFFLNYDRRTNWYEDTARSSMILNLFDLDFYIKQLLWKYVIKIENKLNTSLLYCIWKRMFEIDTQWCSWATQQSDFIYNAKDNKWILDDHKIEIFKKTIFDNNITNDQLNNLVNNTLKNCITNDSLFKEFQNNKINLICAPFYKIFLKLDFGTTLNFFKYLKNCIKRDIINMILISNYDLNNEIITLFLYIIKEIRNKIAHNEVIYKSRFYFPYLLRQIYLSNFRESIFKESIKKIRSLINLKINSLYISDVINIIKIFYKVNPSDLVEYRDKINNYVCQIQSCHTAASYISRIFNLD